MFTLILSFRAARLASRTRDEDNRAFTLFRELSALSGRGLIASTVCDLILTIDSSQGPELKNAYTEVRRHIVVALRRAREATDREKLIAAQAALDALAHSRQQGINFGELCALFIFAGITVGFALFLRPETSGLTGFLIEMFTMLFSAVIVFFGLQCAGFATRPQRSDFTPLGRWQLWRGFSRLCAPSCGAGYYYNCGVCHCGRLRRLAGVQMAGVV